MSDKYPQSAKSVREHVANHADEEHLISEIAGVDLYNLLLVNGKSKRQGTKRNLFTCYLFLVFCSFYKQAHQQSSWCVQKYFSVVYLPYLLMY